MTRPDSRTGPRPRTAVLGGPSEPAHAVDPTVDPAVDADVLLPGGVWPPPPPVGASGLRARGDPPTAPLPPVTAPPGSPPEGGPRRSLEDLARSAGRSGPHPGGFPDETRHPPVPAPEPGGRLGGVLRRLAPAGWRGARVDPGRPGATALAIVAAVAAVLAAVAVWFERPRAEPVADLPAVTVVAEPSVAAAPAEAPRQGTAPAPAPTAAAPAPPPAPLVVSVSGKVHRPGLVEVPAGARVADVLEAAGGALPGTDLSGLNLARRVADGEQVAVGVPPAPDALPGPAPGAVPSSPASGAPAGKVDLNTATVEQLDSLPGVGPVTAQRILEWRSHHGRFSRVEQLREVEGIGERRFAQLRELVVV
jgi:competence protein ComEA